MEEYAILGGGGNAVEISEYMLAEDKKICGYYSLEENNLLSSMIPYLGDERKNFNPNLKYIVASGLINIRKKMINFIEKNNLQVGSFISKHAYLSKNFDCGKGLVVAPFAVIGQFTNIGDYVFINVHGTVGHDAYIGKNVVIGPGAIITGSCKIGNNVMLGSNAALVPNTILEDDVEIGILTYPMRKVKAGRFILSEPGRTLRENV